MITKEIPITALINRRTTFPPEDIKDMADSIRQFGVMHPITVQRLPFDGQFDKYEIVAGKLRVEGSVVADLHTVLSVIFEPGIPEDTMLEMHLHENLKRQNLAWHEQAQLNAELHELRVRQHGGLKARGRLGVKKEVEDKKWGVADTALELKRAAGAISEDLAITHALRVNPSLRKVKDKKTALKLIREATRRQTAIEESAVPSDFEMNQVLCGDSLDILKHIPSETFDACITDPPWLVYKDASLIRDTSTIEVFKEIYRVLKPNSFLYVIMSTLDVPDYKAKFTEFGFKVQDYLLIWSKMTTITHGRPAWGYARDYEPIMLAVKGTPILTSPTEMSSVISIPAVHPTKLIHPNEKPIELLKKLILDCTYDGAKIIEPFAGSGVTLSAAKELGREFIGIERDYKFFEGIKERLAK